MGKKKGAKYPYKPRMNCFTDLAEEAAAEAEAQAQVEAEKKAWLEELVQTALEVEEAQAQAEAAARWVAEALGTNLRMSYFQPDKWPTLTAAAKAQLKADAAVETRAAGNAAIISAEAKTQAEEAAQAAAEAQAQAEEAAQTVAEAEAQAQVEAKAQKTSICLENIGPNQNWENCLTKAEMAEPGAGIGCSDAMCNDYVQQEEDVEFCDYAIGGDISGRNAMGFAEFVVAPCDVCVDVNGWKSIKEVRKRFWCGNICFGKKDAGPYARCIGNYSASSSSTSDVRRCYRGRDVRDSYRVRVNVN